MIGIIGAMDQEVRTLVNEMSEKSVNKKAGMEFCSGRLLGKDVTVVISGVGKVSAAACTQILVDDYHVDAVINSGVAGSLDSRIDIGDIVVSTDAVQHDVEATIWGYMPGEIPILKKAYFEADPGLRKVIVDACRKVNTDIHVFEGRVASGDQFVSSMEQKKKIRDTFHACCAEMEGCAIAQTAWLNRIPFVIIRAISDKADNSATMDYNEFEKKAIEHSLALLRSVLPQLNY